MKAPQTNHTAQYSQPSMQPFFDKGGSSAFSNANPNTATPFFAGAPSVQTKPEVSQQDDKENTSKGEETPATNTVSDIPSAIRFHFIVNTDNFAPGEEKRLIKSLPKDKRITIDVRGMASSEGPEKLNQDLSAKRAQKAAEIIRKSGYVVNKKTATGGAPNTAHDKEYRSVALKFNTPSSPNGETVVNYIVPGMTLIPQTMKLSCWYASAKMLINWRRENRKMSEEKIIDPSEDKISEEMKKTDTGITNPQIVGLAKRLGLEQIPPMSPTKELIQIWLKQYGPLWVNGKSHIVVIAGIIDNQLLVYDPSPRGKGTIELRSIEGWYVGNETDSRDVGSDVQTVFLHCPN